MRLDHKILFQGVVTPPPIYTHSDCCKSKFYAIAEIDSGLRIRDQGLENTSPRTPASSPQEFLGGYAEGVTPVPIPNTEVKPLCADGTWDESPWESRSPPGSYHARQVSLAGFLRSYPIPMPFFSYTGNMLCILNSK